MPSTGHLPPTPGSRHQLPIDRRCPTQRYSLWCHWISTSAPPLGLGASEAEGRCPAVRRQRRSTASSTREMEPDWLQGSLRSAACRSGTDKGEAVIRPCVVAGVSCVTIYHRVADERCRLNCGRMDEQWAGRLWHACHAMLVSRGIAGRSGRSAGCLIGGRFRLGHSKGSLPGSKRKLRGSSHGAECFRISFEFEQRLWRPHT